MVGTALTPTYKLVTTDHVPGMREADAERLEQVLREKEQVAKELSHVQSVISRFNSSVQADNRDVITRVMALEAELHDLLIEFSQLDADDTDDDLDKDLNDFFQEEAKADVEEEHAPVKKVSKEIAKLFRKIANLTHPDKTQDPNKHAMFLAAKRCKDCGDADGLRMILNALLSAGSDLLNALNSRLQAELEELSRLKHAYQKIVNSFDFELATLWTAQPLVVSAQVRQQILAKERNLKANVEAFRRKVHGCT